jgi:hypothetical protein
LCPKDYEAWRRRQIAYGRFDELSDYTDARPAHEHAVALRAGGVGLDRIVELSGLARRTVQEVCRREPGKILKSTAAAILSVPLPEKPHDEQVANHLYVDPTGTVRRLQALVLAGWPMMQLSERMGYRHNMVSDVLRGRRKFITAGFARKADALFAELELTPGPSDAARAMAAEKGWLPALAWDDDTIDDPNAKPQHNIHRRAKFTERFLELRDHVGIKDVDLIAERLNIDPHSVRDQIRRYRGELAS